MHRSRTRLVRTGWEHQARELLNKANKSTEVLKKLSMMKLSGSYSSVRCLIKNLVVASKSGLTNQQKISVNVAPSGKNYNVHYWNWPQKRLTQKRQKKEVIPMLRSMTQPKITAPAQKATTVAGNKVQFANITIIKKNNYQSNRTIYWKSLSTSTLSS